MIVYVIRSFVHFRGKTPDTEEPFKSTAGSKRTAKASARPQRRSRPALYKKPEMAAFLLTDSSHFLGGLDR